MSATRAIELGVKIGDFFVDSWGYDQTNIDFYKVVGMTAKMIKVQAWQSRQVDGDGGPAYNAMVPGDGPKEVGVWRPDGQGGYDYVATEAPVELKRLTDAGKLSISINSYRTAFLWDGRARYETDSLYGR